MQLKKEEYLVHSPHSRLTRQPRECVPGLFEVEQVFGTQPSIPALNNVNVLTHTYILLDLMVGIALTADGLRKIIRYRCVK